MGIECNCSPISGDFELKGVKIGLENTKNEKTNCYKCGRPAIISSRENSCKDCFLSVFSKNFRSNLRTKCLEEKDSNRILAILYSGGFVSSSLLHLILNRNNDRHLKVINNGSDDQGKDEIDFTFRKITDSDDLKLRFLVNVQNPLDEEEFKLSSREQFRVIRMIFENFTNKFKFEMKYESNCLMECMMNNIKLCNIRSCYFLHIQNKTDYNNSSNTNDTTNGRNTGSNGHSSSNYDINNGSENINFIEECTDRCHEFMSNCRRLFREDPDCGFHIWRTIRLINLRAYFKMNLEKKIYLLVPETQDDICKKALFLTCVGLGEEVSNRCSFVDRNSFEEHRILRPLKNFTLKELAFYNKFNELEQVSKSRFQFNFGSNSSIFGCISYFTDELNLQHSNIFHNITKITNRLINKPDGQLEFEGIRKGCSICSIYSKSKDESKTNINSNSDLDFDSQPNVSESAEVCKGCKYFSIKHSEILEYFKKVFSIS